MAASPQPLKSPLTATLVALGAQTRKVTPVIVEPERLTVAPKGDAWPDAEAAKNKPHSINKMGDFPDIPVSLAILTATVKRRQAGSPETLRHFDLVAGEEDDVEGGI
jgi:hypothetical protein